MCCHTSPASGVFMRDDREKLRLPKRSSVGDGERELITALYPALRRIAAVAGSVDVEPDDLVQEALMRVLRKGSISDLDNPLAYLRKTIVNLASNQRRSLGRRRKAVARLPVEESWSPSYPADIEAILDLPPKQQGHPLSRRGGGCALCGGGGSVGDDHDGGESDGEQSQETGSARIGGGRWLTSRTSCTSSVREVPLSARRS